MSVTSATPTPLADPAAAASVFRATTPDDQPRLTAFLARAFAMDAGAPFLEPSLVRWKFWEPRGDFTDPRSYVLERGGRIAGHVGLWPATIGTARGPVTAIQMIDWASDPDAPGAGASIVQKLLRRYDVIYSVGGSEATRRVLPRLGFRQAAEVWIAARPLRPLARRPGERPGVRAMGRMARNLWWSWARGAARPGTEAPPRPIPRADAFFDYLARCPAAAVTVHRFVHRGRGGRVALAAAHGQSRIAGVWLDEPSAGALVSGYRLAQRLARSEGSAAEMTAMGSSAASEAAARAAGLRVRERRPVFLFHKPGVALEPIEFQIADDDACFRYESRLT
jgi:hypothetical protein